MNTALAIGYATTGVTLFVTVVLFTLDRVIARRRERRDLERQLVMRVLDAFDASTRNLFSPAFVQAWSNSEIEYALLAPRLLVDLQGEDRRLVPWLMRQIQHMQMAVNKRNVYPFAHKSQTDSFNGICEKLSPAGLRTNSEKIQSRRTSRCRDG